MTDEPPPPPARLYRSRTDRVIAGIAGGLGRYLGVDPVILRIAFVILLLSGPGLLIYLIGWVIIPEAPEGAEAAEPSPLRTAGSSEAMRLLIGGLLVAAGVIVLLDRLFPWFDRVALPALLIAVGAAVLVYGARR